MNAQTDEAMVIDTTDYDVAPVPTGRAMTSPAAHGAIATTTPADLLRIAVESNCDLDRLQKLMELQQAWEANEARKAFVVAMSEFKKMPLQIFKKKGVGYPTADGGFVGYKHAELHDVTDVIGPAMAKHGLSYDWNIIQSPGSITVECVVTHVLGHSKKVSMSGAPDTSGKKNQIQQAASTVTYLQRYTLLAASGMATKDEPADDDGAGGADPQPEGAAQAQAAKPFYAAEDFEKNKASWREVVKSGRKTPSAMVKFIETKGALLTEAQKNTIDAWSHEDD